MPDGQKGEKQVYMTKPEAKRVFDRIYGQMDALASIRFMGDCRILKSLKRVKIGQDTSLDW